MMIIMLRIKNILLFLLVVCIISLNAYFSISYAENSKIQQGQVNLTQGTKIGFEKTGKMEYKHVNHKAILLPNGKVLIFDTGTPPEIFNPETNTYKELKHSTIVTYSKLNLSLLNDGNVLIVADISKLVPYMELFDYKTETFKEFNPNLPYELKTSDSIRGINIIALSPNIILFVFGQEYYIYNYSLDTYKKIDWNYNEFGEIGYLNQLTSNNFNDIVLITYLKSSTKIVKYDQQNEKFILLKTINIPTYYPIKVNNIIYFFTGTVSYDNSKSRIRKGDAAIYSYDIETNNFKKLGYLYKAGTEGGIILSDGSIMFNAGKFDLYDKVQYEIYHPTENKSSFTEPIKWYRKKVMTLLNDGSVLFSGGYFYTSDWIQGTNHSCRYYPTYNNHKNKLYKIEPNNIKPSIKELVKEVKN